MKSATDLAWLHLSDIHFMPETRWRDVPCRRALLAFLKAQFDNGALPRPDLIFCTGDIAFGHGEKMPMRDQYADARVFFDELLACCGNLSRERLFVVPGNHDVMRSKINQTAQKELINMARNPWQHLDQINGHFPSADFDHGHALGRLTEYGAFVADYLAHQEDPNHHYAQVIEINGRKIGIAGLNSAWSCSGPEDEGHLWLSAERQFGQLVPKLESSVIRIGLMHHPTDSLNLAEQDTSVRLISKDFHFWLYGHRHNAWVDPGQNSIKIAAGAVGADNADEFGINLVKLDFQSCSGKVHLFTYVRKSTGWATQDIPYEAPGGIWSFRFPERLNAAPKTDAGSSASASPDATTVLLQSLSTRTVLPFEFKPPHDVPAVLPPGEFVGRRDIFDELLKGISARGSSIGIHGLSGMGGIGKSELARQLVHILAQRQVFADGILWLRINRNSYAETLSEIWLGLGGVTPMVQNAEAMTRELHRVLAGRKMLVVLDNCDEPDRLPALLDLFSEQSVLVTTRNPQSLRIEWHELGLLSACEARELLRALHRPLASVADAEVDDVVVRRLGRLPLAISLAGHWLRSTKRNLSEYGRRFDRYKLDAMGHSRPGEDVRLSDIRACFDVSWDPLTPLQRQVFALASLFGGDSFPEALFVRWIAESKLKAPKEGGTAEFLSADEDMVIQAIDVLVVANLFSRPSGERLAVHALLRDYGREQKLTMDVLGDYDARTIGALLYAAAGDGAGEFAIAEAKLIEETLLQLAKWPTECLSLLERVDNVWAVRGRNAGRSRVLGELLKQKVWSDQVRTDCSICLELADAELRLGRSASAQRILEAVCDSAQGRNDDGQVVRSRYLLRSFRRARSRNEIANTLRRGWCSDHADDAQSMCSDLFGIELAGDATEFLRSRCDGVLNDFGYCLDMLNLAAAEMEAGQEDLARDRAESALRFAVEKGFLELECHALQVMGHQALWQKKFDDARRLYAKALELATVHGLSEDENFCYLGLVRVALDDAQAVESVDVLLHKVQDEAERMGQVGTLRDACILHQELALARGQPHAEVHENLMRLRREAVEHRDIVDLLVIELLAVTLDLRIGLPANREAALRRLERVDATLAGWQCLPLDCKRLREKIARQFDGPLAEWPTRPQAKPGTDAIAYDLRPAWLAQAERLPTRLQGSDGMELCLVGPGLFPIEMFRDGRWIPTRQWIYPFYIDRHPVTVAQYARFCAATGRSMPPSDGFGSNDLERGQNRPVVRVALSDARAYAQWVRRCLPLREEWVAAARGKAGRRYPWGDDFSAAKFPEPSRRDQSLISVHPLSLFDEAGFLDLLASSLSLSLSEKRRVIEAIPTLSQFQIDELLKVFRDEAADFERLRPTERDTVEALERDAQQRRDMIWSILREVCGVTGDEAECGARDLLGLVREWFEQPEHEKKNDRAIGAPMGADLAGIHPGMELVSDVGSDGLRADKACADSDVGFRCVLPLSGDVPLPESIDALLKSWQIRV